MLTHWKNIIHGADTHGFNFEFSLTHYNIYPWIAEVTTLVRVHLIPTIDSPIVSKIENGNNELIIYNSCKRKVTKSDQKYVREQIIFCLGLDVPMKELHLVAKKDPVLTMALKINKGIRPKRYSDLFEAVCGAVCAQNVDFRRLYTMMELLSKRFGRCIAINDNCYWSFPTPEEIINASVVDLKKCKVGYRAKRILDAARWFVDNKGSDFTVNHLREMDRASAMEAVCNIPGIGPYSTAIVLSAGAGRHDIFHLDSFTRHILREMYFSGKETSDELYLSFVEEKWGQTCGLVAHLLTTNTEIWTAQLGWPNFRRSGGRNL